jgi:hypothetical protein
MRSPITIMTPRYQIQGVKGDYFDVFSQRKNAIRGAIKLAIEYPGATFLVVKKVNQKDKTIFRFKIEADFDFDDIQEMYRGVIEAYQKKLDKTKYWRK